MFALLVKHLFDRRLTPNRCSHILRTDVRTAGVSHPRGTLVVPNRIQPDPTQFTQLTERTITMALALDPRYVVEFRPRPAASPDMATVYRRRRIAVAALALGLTLILTVAASAGIRSLASRGDGAAPVSAVTPGSTSGVDVSGAFVVSDGVYVVQPGDTLWSIASSLTDGSIRGYVADLIELNGGASIDVGQLLVLPGR